MRVLLRLLRLTAVLARQGLGLLISSPPGTDGPTRLRLLLEAAGGTWLKFGQVLSLQPDILPRAYCNALFDLLDRVPPFSLAAVERTFSEDLGRRPTEIFDHFDPVPLASASIGQVHAARLGDRKVAVKIRRPDVETSFEPDLRLMGVVAGAIDRLRIKRLYWLRRALSEFIDWTREELDYRYEARFMAALAVNARTNPREAVPELHRELSTARILVADLLEGPMVVEYLRAIEAGRRNVFEADLEPAGFDRERLARNIVRNFVSDAFVHGLFHADLHPANLLILDDSVVGYVDFGITGSLSGFARRNLVALTLALARADIDAMMRHYLPLATIDRDSDVPAFRSGLANLLDEWFDTDRERPLMRSSFTRVMVDMLHLSRRTGVVPTPDMIRYLRSVITADGLIARFAPDFDVGGYLEAVCEEDLREQQLGNLASPAALAEWMAGGARLFGTVPVALAELLDNRAVAGSSVTGRVSAGDDRRALQWGLIALVAAVVTVLGGGEHQVGINLFTAGLTSTAAAATMFAVTVRRMK